MFTNSNHVHFETKPNPYVLVPKPNQGSHNFCWSCAGPGSMVVDHSLSCENDTLQSSLVIAGRGSGLNTDQHNKFTSLTLNLNYPN